MDNYDYFVQIRKDNKVVKEIGVGNIWDAIRLCDDIGAYIIVPKEKNSGDRA